MHSWECLTYNFYFLLCHNTYNIHKNSKKKKQSTKEKQNKNRNNNNDNSGKNNWN